MTHWKRGWWLAAGAVMTLCVALARGEEARPAGVWKFDEDVRIEKVPIFHWSLAAIDDRTIVVHSSSEAEQLVALPPKLDGTPRGAGATPVDVGQPVPRQIRELGRDNRIRRMEVTWQEVDRQVPGAAKNLADAALGANFSGFGVTLPKPVEINTVVIHTVGELVHGRNRCGIRDYQLRCRTPGGNWITVAAVRNNMKEYLVHTLAAGGNERGSR